MAKRAGFILCLVVCALGVGASHARADSPPPSVVIAAGVQIGAVDVSGLTAEQATAAVEHAYFAPVVLHVVHRGYSVSPHHFHAALGGLAAAVQTALTAPADTAIRLTPTLDTKLVAKHLSRMFGNVKTGQPSLYVYRCVATTPPETESRALREKVERAESLGQGEPGRAYLAWQVSADTTVIVAPVRKLEAAAIKAEPVIVIHRGSNRLYLYNGTHFVRVFPVATGQAAWPTPLGHFQIVVKQRNPWWFPPTQDSWAAGAKPVPPGPGNPLGTRWMGLSAPGVGIHGTSEPWSIGHSESHGCIRMQIASAEWLFNRVRIGTPVFIVPA